MPTHEPLSLVKLHQLEAELCQPGKRLAWWMGSDDEWGAVAGMIKAVLDFRRRHAKAEPFERITHGCLGKHLEEMFHESIDKSAWTKFFQKSVNGDVWGKRVKPILRYLLLGDHVPDENAGPSETMRVAERILESFLPTCANWKHLGGGWFFSTQNQFKDWCVTERELVAELWGLRFRATRPNAEAPTITRVSGSMRFAQVDDKGQPTASWEATVACLEAGIAVRYVYADLGAANNPARESFETIEKLAAPLADEVRHRLYGVALSPGANRVVDTAGQNGQLQWAGEYLHRHLQWSFHEQVAAGAPQATLLVSRGPHLAPSYFRSKIEEQEGFRAWMQTFVEPGAHKHAESNPGSSARVRRTP